MPDYEYENAVKSKGFKLVCGVDEAGRGPLAGPVCAAAVILPENAVIEGLNDSKKLSEKKREALYDVIKEKAIAFCVAYGTLDEIETLNILQATFFAMNRAIDGLAVKPDFALIDGNRVPKDIKIPCETVVKGDGKSMSVAAASESDGIDSRSMRYPSGASVLRPSAIEVITTSYAASPALTAFWRSVFSFPRSS